MKHRHIIKYIKLYFFPVMASLLFVVFFYLGVIGLNPLLSIVDRHNAEQVTKKVDTYFRNNEDRLLSIARNLSGDRSFKNALSSSNIEKLDGFGKNINYQNNVDNLLVTNKDGLVLSRSNASNIVNDYVFETTGWGRALVKQNEIEGVGVGEVWPLVVVGGKQITDDKGALTGSALSFNILNNDFANLLKKYSDSDIVFYSQKFGIVGDSFGNNKISNILTSYFTPNSDFLKKDRVGMYVRIADQDYFVYNVSFHGFNENFGGYLVFVPQHEYGNVLAWSIIVPIFLFIFFYGLHRLKLFAPTNEMLKGHAIILGIMVSLTVIFPIIFIITQYYMYGRYVNVSKPIRTIYNSTLSLSPSFAIFDKTNEQPINVVVSTGGEIINLVHVAASFDPSVASVVDVDFNDPFCAKGMLIEKNIDNLNGKVMFTCVVVTPGFSGAPEMVATIIFQPKRAGDLAFTFDNESSVLANDGVGTDVLRQSEGGSYEIVDRQNDPGKLPQGIVFSPTHPNGTRWYNVPAAEFIWQGGPGDSFIYDLDQSASSTLILTSNPFSGSTTSRDVTMLLDEGAHYFHLIEIKNGEAGPVTVTYPVKIDLTPPDKPKISLMNDTVNPDDVIQAVFSSKDALSGLQKNYYVSYDNGTFYPTISPLSISFSEVGQHSITVRAYDNAGNFSDNTVYVEVK